MLLFERDTYRKLGLAVVASALCLIALELVFRLAGYKAIYDVYSKPELFWQKDPLLGWSHEPGSSGVYVGPRPFPIEFHGHVRINSLGLRGAELPEVPAAGTTRVLVLGDSVVAGFEVDEEKTFEAILQRELPARVGHLVEVVNAGVRGYGTDQSFLYLRERGVRLHPDLVVFFASNNDLEDNTTLHRARRPFGKPAFGLNPDGALNLIGSPAPPYPFCAGVRLDADFHPIRIDDSRQRILCWIQTHLSDHSALFTFATLRIQQNPQLVYRLFRLTTPDDQATVMTHAGERPVVSPAGRLTTALILEMARAARDGGADFLLAIHDYDLAALDRPALTSAGIEPFLLNAIAPGPTVDTLSWKNDSHWNEAGHRRAAEVLSPVLEERIRAVDRRKGKLGGIAP